MKTKSYLFSILLIAFSLVALPAVAADTAPGFKNADCTVGPTIDASGVAVAVARSDKGDALIKTNTAAENIKIGLSPCTEIAKTGTGVFNTADLVSYNRMESGHRLSPFEVGWQINA